MIQVPIAITLNPAFRENYWNEIGEDTRFGGSGTRLDDRDVHRDTKSIDRLTRPDTCTRRYGFACKLLSFPEDTAPWNRS